MNESPSPAPVLLRRDRTSGLAIVVGVIVSVAMMSHHPTGGGHAGAAGVAEAAHVAGLNRFVHGALIAASLVLAFGFQGFAAQLARPLARFALLLYVAGTAAMVGAALVNGFVFPAVMERWSGRSDAEIELALGMPRDLDNDGAIDNPDVRTGARLLPVLITLRWRGVGGDRQLVRGFYVLGY